MSKDQWALAPLMSNTITSFQNLTCPKLLPTWAASCFSPFFEICSSPETLRIMFCLKLEQSLLEFLKQDFIKYTCLRSSKSADVLLSVFSPSIPSSCLFLPHSLQVYERGTNVEQFVTRFLLKESANQIQSLLNSVESAVDAIDEQHSSVGWERALFIMTQSMFHQHTCPLGHQSSTVK